MKQERTVWVVGDWKHADFGDAVAWLKSSARCVVFDNATGVLSDVRVGESGNGPAAILLVQSRPGQISRGDVERLHAAAPLARLIALVGSWCQGEARGGGPWPGVVRIPITFWHCRLEQELGLAGGNGRWPGPLPRTMTAAERIESTLAALKPSGHRAATAVVFSSRRASYEAIADMLRQLGIESVWRSESAAFDPAADIVVFDGWEDVSAYSSRPSVRQDGISPPRVLLLHFPRGEDYERAASQGINDVLTLPLLLSDLATTLDKAMRTAAGPLACASGL